MQYSEISNKTKVAFISFGCKVNRAEMDRMVEQLPQYGAEYIQEPMLADVVIVNTCAVTEKAQKEGERYLRQIKKANPTCIITATGCIAELYKDDPAALGVDVFVSNTDKDSLMARVFKNEKTEKAQIAPVKTLGTRAFLKIQDGCDSFCSYCIIPHLRGMPKSKALSEVLAEAEALVAAGYKEIVLTGIHAGLYGKDLGGDVSMNSLLKELLKIEGDFRMRISSLYVNEIDEEFVDIIAGSDEKICPHFHISIQSASAEILRRMNRKYSPTDIKSVITLVRSKIPLANIGADVITGFPGETEELFAETFSVLQEIKLDYLHVFPYSSRPKTPAAGFTEQIPAEIKQMRAKKLRALAAKHKLASGRRLIGSVVRVLTETGNKGHSAGFHLLSINEPVPANEFIMAKVAAVLPDGTIEAEVVK